MNKRKTSMQKSFILNLETLQSLETDALLKKYSEVIQEKYDFYNQLFNFVLFHAVVQTGPFLLPPAAQFLLNQLGFQKNWQEYYHYDVPRKKYEETMNYLRDYFSDFTKQHCPYFPETIGINPFLECSKEYAAILDAFGSQLNAAKNNLRKELENILGKMAWFSFNYPNLVALDPKFRKLYPQNDFAPYLKSFENKDLDEMIKAVEALATEMDQFNDKFKLNRSDLTEFEFPSKGKYAIFFDKFTVAKLNRNYEIWIAPFKFLLELGLLNVESILCKNLITNWFRFKSNQCKEEKIKIWTNKKIALLFNKKELEELKTATETEEKWMGWKRKVLFCANGISASVFFAKTLQGTPYFSSFTNVLEDAENSSLGYLSLYGPLAYNFITFSYASYNLIHLFYNHWYSLDTVLNQHQININNAIEKVRYQKVKFYKGANVGNSLFFLPITDYKRLKVEKVNQIIQRNLIRHGHFIHTSGYDGAQRTKIVIGINQHDDAVLLRKNIEKELKSENRAEKIIEQLESLCQCIKLNGQFRVIKSYGNLIGELTFTFIDPLNTEHLAAFFQKYLPELEIKISHDKEQLKLMLPSLNEEKFSSIFMKVKENIKELKFNSCTSIASHSDTKVREISEHASVDLQEKVRQQNMKAQEQKMALKTIKRKQFNEKMKQQANEKRKRNVELKGEEPSVPTIHYFEINDGDDLKNPPMIKFNTELKDKIFYGDERMYSHFFHRIRNGFSKNMKGDIFAAKVDLRDFETNEKLIPSRKIKGYGHLYKNIRLYTIKKEEIINGTKREIQEVRGISNKPHKK